MEEKNKKEINGECEVKEETINKKSKKNNEDKVLAIVLVILIIFLGGYIIVNEVPSIKSSVRKLFRDDVKLTYTETSDANSNSDGIYITDVSEVVENAMPSIVAITSKTLVSSGLFGPSYYGSRYTEGAGSGIIIAETDDYIMILTNNHVIADATELSVQFIDEESYDATVVGTSERKDVAVIAVSKSDIKTSTLEQIKIATIGSSDDLKVGNGIIAIGNALGYGQSVTTGVVSALNREVTIDDVTSKMIQIDAAINGGNSGGALLNSKGEVVGINSAKYSSSSSSTSASVEGMGFAIPISDVSDLITELMNGDVTEDESVSIGVEGYIIDSQYSESRNIPEGFYISAIASGTGAEDSDLEIGNIITEIEGEKVEALSDIKSVLSEKKKGDTIELTVAYVSKNEYKEKNVEVTLK